MSNNTGLAPVNVQALTEDAANRAKRTLWQGLAFDVLLALAIVVFNVLNSAQGWDDLDWKLIAFSLFKTAFIAAASFVMRRFLDSSKVPTPLPPAPVPVPNEDAPVVAEPDAPDDADVPDGEQTDSVIHDAELDWPEDDPEGEGPPLTRSLAGDPNSPWGHMPEGVDVPGGDDHEVDAPMDHDRELEDKAGE